MSIWRCLSCEGTYADVAATGEIYFHACPDLPKDASDEQRRDYNPRNENLRRGGLGSVPQIKAQGKGVTCVDDPELTQPIWITNLDALQAQEDEG